MDHGGHKRRAGLRGVLAQQHELAAEGFLSGGGRLVVAAGAAHRGSSQSQVLARSSSMSSLRARCRRPFTLPSGNSVIDAMAS